jgi:hypothetical protein
MRAWEMMIELRVFYLYPFAFTRIEKKLLENRVGFSSGVLLPHIWQKMLG